MSHEFDAARLDIKAFATASGVLSGADLLSKYERLSEEADGRGGDGPVHWTARGELVEKAGGPAGVWLHLKATASLPMVCQRCLGPVDVPLSVARSFRFVATEAQAQAEDEDAQEDVLALSRDFNLVELIEDELLMELPLVPRHEVCPTEVKLAVQDPGFEASVPEKNRPFAVLAGLRGGKPS